MRNTFSGRRPSAPGPATPSTPLPPIASSPSPTGPAAAASGFFGGLIASGWHTAGLMMRLFTQHFLSPESSLASPGIDELRWPKPVRPGDILSIRVTVTEARRSRSKPQQGIVHSFVEVLNQHDEVVMTLKPVSLIRCRPE